MLPPLRHPIRSPIDRQQIERQRDLQDVMTSEQRRWFRRDDGIDVKRSAEEIVFAACDIVQKRGLNVNFAAVRGTGLVGGMSTHVVRVYVDQWNARARGPKQAPAPNLDALQTTQMAISAAAPEPEGSVIACNIPMHLAAPVATEPQPIAATAASPALRGRFTKTIDSPRRGLVTPVESLVLVMRTPLSGGMLDLRALIVQGTNSAT